MIELNKHPAGRVSNIIFGLCSILDGSIRVFSLGFLHSIFTLSYTRKQAKKSILKMKQRRSEYD